MNPDRAQRFRELYNSLSRLPENERAARIEEIAESEPDLASELEGVLANASQEPRTRPGAATLTIPGPGPGHTVPAHGTPSPLWRRVLLVAAAAAALLAYVSTFFIIAQYEPILPEFGWGADFGPEGWSVSLVEPNGPAAGKLQLHDRIVSINGNYRIRGTGFHWAGMGLRSGDMYTVTVRRGAGEKTVQLTAAPNTDGFPYRIFAVYSLTGLTFLVTAIIVALRRPHERLAQLAAFACFAQSLVLIRAPLDRYTEITTGWARLALCLETLLDGPHYALACGVYLAALSESNRRIKFRWLIGLVAALELVPVLHRLSERGYLRLPFLEDDSRLLWSLNHIVGPLYILAPLGVCIAIWAAYRSLPEGKQRLQARWILIGGLSGFLPFVCWRLLETVIALTGYPAISRDLARTLNDVGIVCTVFIPASITYAILTRKLFGVREGFYRTLQFVLAKPLLVMLLVIPFGAAGFVVFQSRNRMVAEVLLHSGPLRIYLVLCLASLFYRQRLLDWVKVKIGDLPSSRIQLADEWGSALSGCSREADLLEAVGVKLMQFFKPEFLQVFGRSSRSGDFYCGFSRHATNPAMEIPAQHSLLNALQTAGGSIDRRQLKARSIDAGLVTWLDDREADLVIAIREEKRPIDGLIVLGTRVSRSRYSKSDQAFLKHLAGIAATHLHLAAARRQAEEMDFGFATKGAGIRICPAGNCVYGEYTEQCPVHRKALGVPISIPFRFEHYELQFMLGRGGMGIVFSALNKNNQQLVALKTIRPEKRGEFLAIRRFIHESEIHSRLKHKNVAALYESYGGAFPCIIMEYVPGRSLRELIRKAQVSAQSAAQWCSDILDALQFAHSEVKVIHRDLKSDNLVIHEHFGYVKILDFGLARPIERGTEETQLTHPNFAPGTPDYMSLEQIRGKSCLSVDLFAVALIAYEMLTGSLPFPHAESVFERERVLELEAARPLPIEGREGSELRHVLARALAKNPAERYQTANELKEVLVPLMATYRRPARDAAGRLE